MCGAVPTKGPDATAPAPATGVSQTRPAGRRLLRPPPVTEAPTEDEPDAHHRLPLLARTDLAVPAARGRQARRSGGLHRRHVLRPPRAVEHGPGPVRLCVVLARRRTQRDQP